MSPDIESTTRQGATLWRLKFDFVNDTAFISYHSSIGSHYIFRLPIPDEHTAVGEPHRLQLGHRVQATVTFPQKFLPVDSSDELVLSPMGAHVYTAGTLVHRKSRRKSKEPPFGTVQFWPSRNINEAFDPEKTTRLDFDTLHSLRAQSPSGNYGVIVLLRPTDAKKDNFSSSLDDIRLLRFAHTPPTITASPLSLSLPDSVRELVNVGAIEIDERLVVGAIDIDERLGNLYLSHGDGLIVLRFA